MGIKIKEFKAEDWQVYQGIRLEALMADPECFCPSRDEFQFKKEDWIERLSSPDSASFGLYLHDHLIGFTGIVRRGESAELVSSYLQKAYRQKGFSRHFYDARIEWAKRQSGVKTLIVEHHQDNKASFKAHQKYGFKYLRTREATWQDGSKHPVQVYELSLKEREPITQL